MHHILVPFERSKAGRAAITHAAMLSRSESAQLTVVMVVRPDDSARCCGIRGPAWDAIQRQVAEEELAKARDVVGNAADLLVRMGTGREELLALAAEVGAETLVEPGSKRRGRQSPPLVTQLAAHT
jgi:nucleotide-binding universal stress UspA family protein